MLKKIICAGVLTVMFLMTENVSAQNDSIPEKKPHSPRKASIFSAVVPGLGQIYNRKYWKPPIIYVAFGTLGYFYVENNNNYKIYKEAYKFRIDDNPNTVDQFIGIYPDDYLKSARDYYRRNLELTVIIGAIVYALNIIDASVDAHLFDFNVSDDLSLRMQPAYAPSLSGNPGWGGIKMTLKF